MFSRQLTKSLSGNAFTSAARPLSCPRTHALVWALCSWRKTTRSSLGRELKMFSLLNSGSALRFGSSSSSTAWGSARIFTSSQSRARFSRTFVGVDWQASA